MSTKQVSEPSAETIQAHEVADNPSVVETTIEATAIRPRSTIPPGVNSFQVAYTVQPPHGFLGLLLLHTSVVAANGDGDTYPVTNVSGTPDPGRSKNAEVLATIWLPAGLIWPPEILINITLDYSLEYPPPHA